jgi:hypothetical protein
MLLLSTRSHVTAIKFIHLKSITVIVELKCYYNIKDMKEQGINHGRGVEVPELGSLSV